MTSEYEAHTANLHDLDPVCFPVVMVDAGNETIELAETPLELRQCSRAALQRHFFDNLEIFDSADKRLAVQSVNPLMKLKGRTGENLDDTLLLSFELSPPQPIRFADLRSQLIAVEMLQDWSNDLQACKTFAEVYQWLAMRHPYY